ncbi:MAG: VWA domain-containing protein [Buchananella hordeovulneris]|nr:VWA domain-containing protein [Buchananella hordeovulneris]
MRRIVSSLAILMLALMPSVALAAGSQQGEDAAATQTYPHEPEPEPTPKFPGARTDGGPLVVVMDTSGSMAEEDRQHPGQTKLETAKKAVNELLGESNVAFGLVTYPSGATGEVLPEIDNCEAGRVLLVPEVRDRGENTAIVNAMTADGGTPTGPALKGAAYWLSQRGYRSATIVLVTDGMHNCGQDPCEAAQEVVDSGIELRVHGIGLTGDKSVEESLACIANKTGGVAVTGVDVSDLKTTIEETRGDGFSMAVNAPTRVYPLGRSSLTQRILVDLRNGGALKKDVFLNFSAKDSKGNPVLVAHPFPVFRMGTLRPHESRKVAITLYPTEANIGVMKWDIAVSAGTRYSAVIAGHRVGVPDVLAEDSGEIDVVAPDGQIQLSGILSGAKNVVVMGDSYSSGENAPPYIAGSGNEQWENRCHRSQQTHAGVLFPNATIIACSGAIANDFYGHQLKEINGQHKLVVPQFKALQDLAAPPDLVVMSVGGNDSGFSSVVTQVLASDSLPKTPGVMEKFIPADLSERVAKVLAGIDGIVNSVGNIAKRGGKIAPILVIPYPNGVKGVTGHGVCAGDIKKDELAFLEKFQDRVNSGVRQGVARVSSRPIFYVENVVNAFYGYSVCGDAAPFKVVGAFEGWLAAPERQQELYHPTAGGYRLEAEAIAAWAAENSAIDLSNYGPAAVPAISLSSFETSVHYFARELLKKAGFKDAADRGSYSFRCEMSGEPWWKPKPEDDKICKLMKDFDLTYFEVRSDPVSLGVYETGADLKSLTVTLPHDLPPGEHSLYSYGVDETGFSEPEITPIYVPSEADQRALVFYFYAVVCTGVALVLALASFVLTWVRKRRVKAGK